MFMVLRRRHARAAFALLSVIGIVTAALAAAPVTAGASVGSDQADIAQLEKQLAADGAHEQALVSRFNQVHAQVDTLNVQIAADQRRLAVDQRAEAVSMGKLRRFAIKAYISGSGMDSPALSMLSGTSSIAALLEQNQYVGAVNTKLGAALDALHADQARTQDAQHLVQSEQQQATKTLAQLTAAHNAATAAITADESRLVHVRGDLRVLLAAAAERADKARAASERALAAARLSTPAPLLPSAESAADPQPVSSLPTSSTTPTTFSPPPTDPNPGPDRTPPSSTGGYANPLRSIAALSPERIDQGVDYSGFGPIYAIGDGVVLMTVGPGWPGGTFIAYRLTGGAARGLVVFAAEDIEASVQVGDRVTSNTVIGHVYAGPDGIETGWADGASLPDTMARRFGQFDGSNSTAFGVNFSQFLQSLGAPGGVQSGAARGSLPASWPRW